MTKIIDRTGKGSELNQAEFDANYDSLSGINEAASGTTYTVDINDQNRTIELTNAGTKTVTLTDIATIVGALHTTDFKVTLINAGAGAATINCGSTDTFNGGGTSITLAQGEVVTIQTDSTQAIWNVINKGYDLALLTETQTFTGDNTFSGTTTFSGTIAGASPLVFEGTTDDAFETSLAITDPTADNTITVGDQTGTLLLGTGELPVASMLGGEYILLHDSKSPGTQGGTPATATWTKRTLTEASDTGNHVSVTSSVIVLDAGTYIVKGSMPGYICGSHKSRLRNTTAGSTLLVGTSEFSGTGDATQTRSVVNGVITVADSQNLEFQYYISSASGGSQGLGIASSSGENEVYSVLEFWKVA